MRKFFALLIAGALAFTAFGCHDHHHHHHDRKRTNPTIVTRPAPPRPAPQRPAPPRPAPRPGQPAPVIVVPQPHR